MTSQKRIDAGLYWDRAWGLVEGCSPVSPGCDHCWAGAQAHIRACQKNEKIKTANEGLTDDHGTFNGTVRFRHDLLDLPFETKKPTVWSIWTDLFHEGVQEKSISDAISISIEPILGPINLHLDYRNDLARWDSSGRSLPLHRIDWVVCGPETGRGKRPYAPEWIQNLADQCTAAGIPFFDKSKNPIRREIPWRVK